MPEDMARASRGDDNAGMGECLPGDPPDRAVGQRMKRRPTAQKDLDDVHSEGAHSASRPPAHGQRPVGGVSFVPGESCRAGGPTDRQPNRYRLSRGRSRPARVGQGARAGGAWRGCVDCWQCRRDRRPAPAPRPRGASVAGAPHGATGEGQERQPLTLCGWPLGRPKSARNERTATDGSLRPAPWRCVASCVTKVVIIDAVSDGQSGTSAPKQVVMKRRTRRP